MYTYIPKLWEVIATMQIFGGIMAYSFVTFLVLGFMFIILESTSNPQFPTKLEQYLARAIKISFFNCYTFWSIYFCLVYLQASLIAVP